MTTTMPLGPGQVVLDDHGRPAAFRHGRLPGLGFLLAESTDPWHTPDRAWGAGFVVGDRGAAQWAVPDGAVVGDAAATQRFHLLDGLALDVERRAGDRLRESYRWTNRGGSPLRITSLTLSTPWRDVYAADGVAQETAVHAHVSASGAQAWTLAKPMHGQGPLLGLVVREGAVRAYSVEARNQLTSSNVRGHLLLHVTDQARHPGAFGGQPTLTLAPGASYRLVWELAWFEDEASFLAAAEPTVAVPELAALVGTALRIEHPAAMRVRPSPSGSPLTGADPGRARQGLAVERTRDGSTVTGRAHGVVELDVGPDDGDAVRVGVLFHRPLAELVRRRVAVLLDRHRPLQRPRPRGFVACDTLTGLTVTDQGWPDWSDGGERTAMAVLLAEARARGLVEVARAAEVDAALEEFAAFAGDHLVGPDGWVRRGSTDRSDPRLYNTPWLVDLLVLQHRHGGRVGHLELATSLLEASARHGVDRHLSIGPTRRRCWPWTRPSRGRRRAACGRGSTASCRGCATRRWSWPGAAATCRPTRSTTSSRSWPRWCRCCRWPTGAGPTGGCWPRPSGPWAGCWPSPARSATSGCATSPSAHGPDPLDNDQDWALVYALRSGLVP
jgi:hypothetical protein